MTTDRTLPPVEAKNPPQRVADAMSAVVKVLMKTPLRSVIGKKLMIVHVVGRRTGKTYHVCIGRHEVGGRTVASLGGRWRFNLRGGATIDVSTDKGVQRARVTVVEDSKEKAEVITAIVRTLGYQKAQYLALKLNVDRLPTAEEVEPAIRDRWAAYFDFLD